MEKSCCTQLKIQLEKKQKELQQAEELKELEQKLRMLQMQKTRNVSEKPRLLALLHINQLKIYGQDVLKAAQKREYNDYQIKLRAAKMSQ